MKKLVLLPLLSLIAFFALGQEPNVIMPPKFEGGKDSLQSFVKHNINYPEEAKKLNKEAIVYIALDIDSTGKVVTIRPVDSYGYGFDEEAVRIARLLPDFSPATNNGQPIKTKYSLPVVFELPKEKQPLNFESQPQFPGGNGALRDFITEKITYPKGEEGSGKAGAVVIQVKVNHKGELTDRRVVKTLGQAFTVAAYNILDEMPQWTPAKANSQPIAMWTTIPFPFTTDDTQKESRSLEIISSSSSTTVKILNYIIDNVKYPKDARKKEKESNVVVRFTIKKSGRTKDIEIVSGGGYGLNWETQRLIRLMPKWAPATKKGKKTEDTVVLQIPFRLSYSK